MEVSVRMLLYETCDEENVLEGLHTGENTLPVGTPFSDMRKAPIYAILLFGGTVSVNHVGGGMTVGKAIKLRALPRIGVLATQLR